MMSSLSVSVSSINFTWTLSFEENPDLQLLSMFVSFSLFAISLRKENDLLAMKMEYWNGKKNRLWIWMRGIFFGRRMQFKYLVKTNILIPFVQNRQTMKKLQKNAMIFWQFERKKIEHKLVSFPIFFSITKDHHKIASWIYWIYECITHMNVLHCRSNHIHSIRNVSFYFTSQRT